MKERCKALNIEKATASLAAVIAFLIMHSSIGAMIVARGGADQFIEGSISNVLGIESLQMGVFGGMIVGLGVAALHNRFYKIQLPAALSFFEGTRFVPIISSIVYLFVGILMVFIWPPVQEGINAIGALVQGSGYAGTWLYGFMERALIPFGLHHVFYLPFWQTAGGGTMESAEKWSKVHKTSSSRNWLILTQPSSALRLHVSCQVNSR